MSEQQGWTISEVEALIGLSRRDIQRCCYEGKGGVGILSPKDSKWGRRTYTEADLARLFLVAQMKARGLSLPEVKRELDRAAADGRTDADLLRDYADRLAEKIEQLETLLLSARALVAADAHTNKDSLYELITELDPAGVIRSCLSEKELSAYNESQLTDAARTLDDPALALTVDLVHGAGAAERVRERVLSQLAH